MSNTTFKHLGVIGAGTMGAGIAQAAALGGVDVILYDINDTILRQSLERIKSDLKKGVEKGKLTPDHTSESFAHIRSRYAVGVRSLPSGDRLTLGRSQRRSSGISRETSRSIQGKMSS